MWHFCTITKSDFVIFQLAAFVFPLYLKIKIVLYNNSIKVVVNSRSNTRRILLVLYNLKIQGWWNSVFLRYFGDFEL